MPRHLFPALAAEIRSNTAHLDPYIDPKTGKVGPGVDYRPAEFAYAGNITLFHDPNMDGNTPSDQAEILQVKTPRSGDNAHERWSGVTGYIDVTRDPKGKISDHDFDPARYTAEHELEEECGIPIRLTRERIAFFAGRRFLSTSNNGKPVHVFPLIGVYRHILKPAIRPDPDEIAGLRWVPLRGAALQPDLSPNYAEGTLPNALHGLGISRANALKLIFDRR